MPGGSLEVTEKNTNNNKIVDYVDMLAVLFFQDLIKVKG
jgi:hypothetical protein